MKISVRSQAAMGCSIQVRIDGETLDAMTGSILTRWFSTICKRSSTFQKVDPDMLGLQREIFRPSDADSAQQRPEDRRSRTFGSVKSFEILDADEELLYFRNVHYVESRKAVTSIVEAEEVLRDDPDEPRALRYKALWHLRWGGFIDDADSQQIISLLETPVKIGRSPPREQSSF